MWMRRGSEEEKQGEGRVKKRDEDRRKGGEERGRTVSASNKNNTERTGGQRSATIMWTMIGA